MTVNQDAGARVVSPAVTLAECDVGAYVTCAVATSSGVVIGGGDGGLSAFAWADDAAGAKKVATLDATPLGAARDVDGGTVLIGTDDGRLLTLKGGGELDEITKVADGWIERIAVHAGRGLRAFAAGRAVHLLGADGKAGPVLDGHPSTVTGIAFAPDGAKLAAAHYDGVSVWTLADPKAPERLNWHGSHTSLAWSPDGRYIVTAMQDKEMHCWRMNDRRGMRMSGYPKKIRTLSWTADSQYLAASGADTVTSWGFSGGGPGGKAPLEFGYVFNGTVAAVAAHPKRRIVAGGYDDGAVLVGDIEKGDAIIARPGGGAAVTALVWSPDGAMLAAGTEKGQVASMRIDPDAMVPVANSLMA